MNSVFIGNHMILNPTDDDRKRAKLFEEERDRKIQEFDNEARSIISVCRTFHSIMTVKDLEEYSDQLSVIQTKRTKFICSGFMWPTPQPYREFFEEIKQMTVNKLPT